jgi:hypothetical protein
LSQWGLAGAPHPPRCLPHTAPPLKFGARLIMSHAAVLRGCLRVPVHCSLLSCSHACGPGGGREPTHLGHVYGTWPYVPPSGPAPARACAAGTHGPGYGCGPCSDGHILQHGDSNWPHPLAGRQRRPHPLLPVCLLLLLPAAAACARGVARRARPAENHNLADPAQAQLAYSRLVAFMKAHLAK